MKLVNVSMRSVNVVAVKPRDMSLELAVSFDDGAERRVKFTLSDIDAQATAALIFSRIRKYEQGMHQNHESETILDSIVSINFRNYIEAFEKLHNFLARAAEKIAILKSGRSEGYIAAMLTLNSMKVEF